MLNRLALLTCHEMGHVLGLEHNFVASTFGRGSVMDYYAPRVKLRADGSADLSDAYMQGTGSYDKYAIEWGYSQGTSREPALSRSMSGWKGSYTKRWLRGSSGGTTLIRDGMHTTTRPIRWNG